MLFDVHQLPLTKYANSCGHTRLQGILSHFFLLGSEEAPDRVSMVRLDLIWWKLFFNDWNGISLMRAVGKQLADVELFSDASSS